MGINSFIGGVGSVTSILEETVQLSKSMIIADAVHDSKIVENVQGLQQRCGSLVRSLQDKLEFLDRASPASVDECLLLCSDLFSELEKDILRVAIETCSKSTGFATKSTVPRLRRSHHIPSLLETTTPHNLNHPSPHIAIHVTREERRG